MKSMTRLTALLLCLSLLLGMAACGAKPVETAPPTEPPTEAPTEPPAEEVYAGARSALDSASDITLEFLVSTSATVADQLFTQESQQKLTYNGLGTDAPMVALEERMTYNLQKEREEDEEIKYIAHTEIYSEGTVYASVEDTYFFSGAVAPEEYAQRYLPVVLLDASLYGDITSQTTDEGTVITFAAPTAPERWAVPADAEMLDASGTALVDASGALIQMNYTVTYRNGPAETTLEVESTPLATAETVTVPENPDSYTQLQYVDALCDFIHVSGMLVQADSIAASNLESVFCQAAGVIRNQSTTMNLHGKGEDVMTKVEASIFLKDYSTNQDQTLEQEEIYKDGRYVITVDDGVPTSQTGIPHETIEEYCNQIMVSHLVDPAYWQDATLTDLGSVYLVEFVFTEDFGNAIQNSICNMFWEDAGFLNKLASAYVTNETTGYLAIDAFTSLPTAAGYYYEGTHTIDGTDYSLTFQSDQSIEAPALGAYHEITEEMLPEQEPEVKATPLFYHVTGENGQEMWLFGTIHVGDERTAYLPQEIYDALEASDALALEYYSNGFDERLEDDDKLQEQISNYYYYTGGSTTSDHVGEEIYEQAEKYLKASGNYNMNAPYMKASVWSNSIENFFLRQGYQLTSEQGCESRLEKLAEDQEKEIRDVESGLFQVKMSTGWSDDLQKVMLEDTLEYSAQEYWEGTWELYELWCAGDEAALREELSDEVDTSELTEEELAEYEAQKHLIEEYNKAMSYDRNDGMLKVAIDYLESGETVFYAVGLAHLLNDVNGLVDTLRAAGYTVELVEYAQ